VHEPPAGFTGSEHLDLPSHRDRAGNGRDRMDRMDRMTKMTPAAARSLAPAAWKERGTAPRDSGVPESCSPSSFRPLARPTPLPPESSSSSCPSC